MTGITLCESVLLRGMLVHSAADYAQLLVTLVGMHEPTFVTAMNQAARSLGLHRTNYADVTGISDGDLSTAQNQATLAADLMTDEPVVQGIVDLPEVSLPVVGVVESFTPFVGQGNVVGVKSGFTNAAGGCDVMAVNDNFVTIPSSRPTPSCWASTGPTPWASRASTPSTSHARCAPRSLGSERQTVWKLSGSVSATDVVAAVRHDQAVSVI
jgi:hypothetical protein